MSWVVRGSNDFWLISNGEYSTHALVNLRTGARVDLAHPAIRSSVADVERQLNGHGRVLLRASGTEPVIRIMIEAEEAASLHAFAESIVEAVRAAATH